MLRSLLYAHFAESLSGLPTIRSYGETTRFLHDNEYFVDLEDRAAILTVTNQRYASMGLCRAVLFSLPCQMAGDPA